MGKRASYQVEAKYNQVCLLYTLSGVRLFLLIYSRASEYWYRSFLTVFSSLLYT